MVIYIKMMFKEKKSKREVVVFLVATRRKEMESTKTQKQIIFVQNVTSTCARTVLSHSILKVKFRQHF